ncbi:hypothetical protein PoB_005270900 [Plakobranchus ocellatus]|uniref:Secreted protein n=1 Tax=Plakobranchus ocellatus TaxID=259542 RepID=A0AAV4C6A0_9GAST|nr:hypothetical protein PoB_005270900 [Plakobranchus ocellatus]
MFSATQPQQRRFAYLLAFQAECLGHVVSACIACWFGSNCVMCCTTAVAFQSYNARALHEKWKHNSSQCGSIRLKLWLSLEVDNGHSIICSIEPKR